MLESSENLSILDMSAASQANISFITDLGHRIWSDDVIGAMQQTFGDDFVENQLAAAKGQRFLDETLAFPDESFDGALVWDTLQFLVSPLLEQVASRLIRIMRPGGQMLLFFNADEKTSRMPFYHYRIQDRKNLLLSARGGAQKVQYFHSRSVERLFEKATSLKFFLTRDHLREVIVRR